MTDLKEQLIGYIKQEAVFYGDFTLTSGKKASYYVDLRLVSLDHRVAPLIGQVMLDIIQDIPDVTAVGGLTMGADPIASSVLHQGALRGLGLNAFVVRKEPKGHGQGKQVEGPSIVGKRVIILEDTSTTGGSPLQAIAAVEKVGAIVAGVAVVVDRNTGAREVIEGAGYNYYAALTLRDLGLE
ncbi:MAG: orotate phosphoribosyltransferase [Microbacteriaceae bacterium]